MLASKRHDKYCPCVSAPGFPEERPPSHKGNEPHRISLKAWKLWTKTDVSIPYPWFANTYLGEPDPDVVRAPDLRPPGASPHPVKIQPVGNLLPVGSLRFCGNSYIHDRLDTTARGRMQVGIGVFVVRTGHKTHH